MINVVGGTELKCMEIAITEGDEIGIYFIGGDNRKLAFVYDSAKKAISSIKKLKKVLHVPYNIATEIEMLAVTEQDTEKLDVKGKKMNVKRNVNIKQFCKACFEQKMEKDEILAKVAEVYTGEGKDEKYAISRAKAVYSSVRKELGLAPQKKGPQKKTETKPKAEEKSSEQTTEAGNTSTEETEIEAETKDANMPSGEEVEV